MDPDSDTLRWMDDTLVAVAAAIDGGSDAAGRRLASAEER